MIDKMSSSLYFKLQKSCKYFFVILETVSCHRLVVTGLENTATFKTSLMISESDLEVIKLENFIVENSLEITQKCSVLALSNLITKIHSCELRYLTIYNQQITFKDFKFLTETQTLEYLFFNNVLIWQNKDMEDRQIVFIEDIVHQLPTVTNLTL